MNVRTAAVVLTALVMLSATAACSRNDAPAADATGPVEATSIQDTPQDLLVGVLRLREKGHPEDAARYFISRDAYRDWNDLKTLDEVDASALCTSSSADCSDTSYEYPQYLSGDTCSKTSSQEAREAGVKKLDETNDKSHTFEVVGTYSSEYSCRLEMRQIDGKWWIAYG
ncbi:MAG: hypothetical protein D8B55_07085 [Actinomyces sp.]|nr:MAG: hypothetical protein D8B55_07085 [Actinomyces sp.]